MPRRLAAPGEILVLGDVNVDIIARVKSFPEPGEECLAPSLELHCGGVGANYAFALRQWSISPRLVACIGQDDFAAFLLRTLANYGVDVSNVQRTSAAVTGLLYINVTPNGQRTFFGSRGANRFLKRMPSACRMLNRAMAVSMMGYSFLDPGPEATAKQLLKAVRARGGWVSLDIGMAPSEQIPRKILQIVKQVDLLFVSSDEATVLTGIRDPRKSFRQLQKAGARDVVMKLGKRGCLILHEGKLCHVPSFAVRTVDTYRGWRRVCRRVPPSASTWLAPRRSCARRQRRRSGSRRNGGRRRKHAHRSANRTYRAHAAPERNRGMPFAPRSSAASGCWCPERQTKRSDRSS